MHHIRPSKLFSAYDHPVSDRTIQLQIPPRGGAGGLTLLEKTVLITALCIAGSKRVFEFGTFLGSTTLNLALNIPDDGEVFTLDLDHESRRALNQHAADVQFTNIHLMRQPDFVGSSVAHKIQQLRGNSNVFDFTPWSKSIECVFIDGGHDIQTVAADTEHAFSIINPDASSCVVWHDYQNPDYPELAGYLDNLASQRPIFHIEDTMICTWFSDPAIQRKLQD